MLEDVDGDGLLDAGDVLRYRVEVAGTPAGRLIDTPGPGARLVPGSVASTVGTVLRGNDPGDEMVMVDLPGLAEVPAIVQFEAVVAPVAVNQGRAHLRTVDSAVQLRTTNIETSDPDVGPDSGPTITPLSGGALATCTTTLAVVTAELSGVTGDADGDGVANLVDGCPDSAAGLAVDERGCTHRQYCAAIDLSRPNRRGTCNNADWLSDEPGSPDPRDCRLRGEECEPF